MQQTKNSLLTYLALATAVIFWGLSFVVTKIALQSFSPFCLIFFRFFTAAIFFIILLWRTGFPSLTRKTLRSLLLLALMQPGLYFLFETFGLQYTSATKTSLIIATIPIGNNIHWREIESLLKHLGAEIESLSGARIRAKLGHAEGILHRPHHGSNALDRHSVQMLREFLARGGATPSQYAQRKED